MRWRAAIFLVAACQLTLWVGSAAAEPPAPTADEQATLAVFTDDAAAAALPQAPAIREARTHRSHRAVTIVGDSQPSLWIDELDAVLDDRFVVRNATFGGAAACDFDPATYVVDAPDVIVFSTAGNSFSPCMSALGGDADLIARTTAAAAVQFCHRVERAGIRCLNALQPDRFDGGAMNVDLLNALLTAQAPNVIEAPKLTIGDLYDGLHPTVSAQWIWADAVAAAVRATTSQPPITSS